MTSRHVFEGTQFKDYTLNYDAENRLVSVTGNATANFVYDGDGKQIKATVNGITAVYVGNHYEVKNSIVTKYYFAGATRLAARRDGTLTFQLGDHLGSSSVTTNASGAKVGSALYKAFGETRYTTGSLNTDYKFTGQREEASLGIYFFVARWFDPSLGRFLSPDTIVPTSTQGTQAWDRYAFVNNNPVRYNDPTGHMSCEEDGYCEDPLCYGLDDCYTTTTSTTTTVSRDDLVDMRTSIDTEMAAQDQKAQMAENIASAILGPLAFVAGAMGCEATAGLGCYFASAAEGFVMGAIPQVVGDIAGPGTGDLGKASTTITNVLDANPLATSFTVTQTVTTQISNDPLAPGEFAQILSNASSFTIDGGGKPRSFSPTSTLAGYNPFAVISSIFGF